MFLSRYLELSRPMFSGEVESLLLHLEASGLTFLTYNAGMGCNYSSDDQSIAIDWENELEDTLYPLFHEIGHYLMDVWGESDKIGAKAGNRLNEEILASWLGYKLMEMSGLDINEKTRASLFMGLRAYCKSLGNKETWHKVVNMFS